MEGTQLPGPAPIEVDLHDVTDDDLRVDFFWRVASDDDLKAARMPELDLDKLEVGISRCWVDIVSSSLGTPVSLPLMVAKGAKPGPVLGLCACLHGNEVQGVPVIHHIMHELTGKELCGAVVGILVANPFGFENSIRGYIDGVDLNRIFPGHVSGNRSSQFVHHFFNKVVKNFTHMIDLHTASLGRANSLYVRADMRHEVCAMMANAQCPQIILHHAGADGSLRETATSEGIPTICVEIGNCSVFQKDFIKLTVRGIWRTIQKLEMLPNSIFPNKVGSPPPPATICHRSFWIYTNHGGILHVFPRVNEVVEKGQVIATVVDSFGIVQAEYMCPHRGIVIGKSTNPVSVQGERIIHLGLIDEKDEFPDKSDILD